MTPEELQASVDAFLRDGGTITRLSYAGVPIDPELSAKDTPAYSAYGRNYKPRIDPVPAPVTVTTVTPADHVAAADLAAAPIRPLRHIEVRVEIAPVAEPRCFYTELRALRADARRVLADLDRWAA